MAMLLGPVLGFRGVGDGGATWRVGVVVVTEGETPSLVWRGRGDGERDETPVRILRYAGGSAWRFEIEARRGPEPLRVRYRVRADGDERAADFRVPGLDAEASPPRLAYASCNGFSDPAAMKRVADKNERWRHLGRAHAAGAYHLLLLGGDQVYGDALWTEEPFRSWSELSRDERRAAPFTKEMRRAAQSFYFRTYVTRWSQEEVAHVLARVPTLMMWDDHDVFDGWGSHDAEDQECPVFRGLFGVAREMFSVFQRGAPVGEYAPGTLAPGALADQEGFGFGHVVDGVAVLALDLRSDRTQDRVMGEAAWDAVVGWLDALAACAPRPRHLLVMSSIPVVYPDLATVESFLGVLPGKQELEDDLRDHWRSRPHRGERLRLVHRLLGVSAAGTRVTILSGDVHAAALGVIESSRDSGGHPNARVVNQLTSSAIVHPPPPALVLYAIESLTSRAEELDRGVTARLLDVPGARRRLLGARNWLAIEGDARGRLWCHWHVEGERDPYTKVIHPVA